MTDRQYWTNMHDLIKAYSRLLEKLSDEDLQKELEHHEKENNKCVYMCCVFESVQRHYRRQAE